MGTVPINNIPVPRCEEGEKPGIKTCRNVRFRPVFTGGSAIIALLRCLFWEHLSPFCTFLVVSGNINPGTGMSTLKIGWDTLPYTLRMVHFLHKVDQEQQDACTHIPQRSDGRKDPPLRAHHRYHRDLPWVYPSSIRSLTVLTLGEQAVLCAEVYQTSHL